MKFTFKQKKGKGGIESGNSTVAAVVKITF